MLMSEDRCSVFIVEISCSQSRAYSDSVLSLYLFFRASLA